MALTYAPETPLPFSDPEDAGFLPDRLGQLGPAMQHYVDTGVLPNLITLVARHGRVVTGREETRQDEPRHRERARRHEHHHDESAGEDLHGWAV